MSIATTSSSDTSVVNTPSVSDLSLDEQTELAIDKFIRNLVFNEGKYGADSRFFGDMERTPSNWTHLLYLMNDMEERNNFQIEYLGNYLDLPSYMRIVRDYIEMYKPENEPTRNLNAILSLIVFARLYARSLKQRLTEVEAASEQYTQRNLERLTTYTTYLIGNLLRDGLQLSWDQFCHEIIVYSNAIEKSRRLEHSKNIIKVMALAAIALTICGYQLRSYLMTKH